MRIHLTEKRSITSETIASMVREPFLNTVHRIQRKCRRDAARKFAEHHRMVLTLRTLPEDILERLPTADELIFLDEDGNPDDISLDMPEGQEFPRIYGLIDSNAFSYRRSYGSSDKPDAFERLADVIACHPVAKAEYDAAEPIRQRGEEFYRLVNEYLDNAGFTTPTQISWSAPELAGCLIHIHGSGGSYGRRSSSDSIFLARLDNRRYVDRSKIRRPKVVVPMPDTLTPYIGEAKLLHTALQKNK